MLQRTARTENIKMNYSLRISIILCIFGLEVLEFYLSTNDSVDVFPLPFHCTYTCKALVLYS